MYCKNCGEKLEEGTKFCKSCGEAVGSNQNSIEPAREDRPQITQEEMEAFTKLFLREQAKSLASQEMVKGFLWFIGGGFITLLTLALAGEGETYFVFWGAMLYGIYRLLRGLYFRAFPDKLLAKAEKELEKQNQANLTP